MPQAMRNRLKAANTIRAGTKVTNMVFWVQIKIYIFIADCKILVICLPKTISFLISIHRQQMQVMSHKVISSVALSIWNCPP